MRALVPHGRNTGCPPANRRSRITSRTQAARVALSWANGTSAVPAGSFSLCSMDLLPTVLAMAGLPAPSNVDGMTCCRRSLASERSPNVRGFPASIKTAKRFAGGASGSREGSRGATAGVRKAPEAGCRRIRRRARRIPSPEGLDCALTRPIARRSRRTSGTSAKRSSGSSAGPSAPGRRETHGQDGRRSVRN